MKIHVYAKYGISFLRFVDPIAKLLETFRLQDSQWLVIKNYGGDNKAGMKPFQEVEINLSIFGERKN